MLDFEAEDGPELTLAANPEFGRLRSDLTAILHLALQPATLLTAIALAFVVVSITSL